MASNPGAPAVRIGPGERGGVRPLHRTWNACGVRDHGGGVLEGWGGRVIVATVRGLTGRAGVAALIMIMAVDLSVESIVTEEEILDAAAKEPALVLSEPRTVSTTVRKEIIDGVETEVTEIIEEEIVDGEGNDGEVVYEEVIEDEPVITTTTSKVIKRIVRKEIIDGVEKETVEEVEVDADEVARLAEQGVEIEIVEEEPVIITKTTRRIVRKTIVDGVETETVEEVEVDGDEQQQLQLAPAAEESTTEEVHIVEEPTVVRKVIRRIVRKTMVDGVETETVEEVEEDEDADVDGGNSEDVVETVIEEPTVVRKVIRRIVRKTVVDGVETKTVEEVEGDADEADIAGGDAEEVVETIVEGPLTQACLQEPTIVRKAIRRIVRKTEPTIVRKVIRRIVRKTVVDGVETETVEEVEGDADEADGAGRESVEVVEAIVEDPAVVGKDIRRVVRKQIVDGVETDVVEEVEEYADVGGVVTPAEAAVDVPEIVRTSDTVPGPAGVNTAADEVVVVAEEKLTAAEAVESDMEIVVKKDNAVEQIAESTELAAVVDTVANLLHSLEESPTARGPAVDGDCTLEAGKESVVSDTGTPKDAALLVEEIIAVAEKGGDLQPAATDLALAESANVIAVEVVEAETLLEVQEDGAPTIAKVESEALMVEAKGETQDTKPDNNAVAADVATVDSEYTAAKELLPEAAVVEQTKDAIVAEPPSDARPTKSETVGQPVVPAEEAPTSSERSTLEKVIDIGMAAPGAKTLVNTALAVPGAKSVLGFAQSFLWGSKKSPATPTPSPVKEATTSKTDGGKVFSDAPAATAGATTEVAAEISAAAANVATSAVKDAADEAIVAVVPETAITKTVVALEDAVESAVSKEIAAADATSAEEVLNVIEGTTIVTEVVAAEVAVDAAAPSSELVAPAVEVVSSETPAPATEEVVVVETLEETTVITEIAAEADTAVAEPAGPASEDCAAIEVVAAPESESPAAEVVEVNSEVIVEVGRSNVVNGLLTCEQETVETTIVTED
ncbi:hypothetical protein HK101_000194, partial [Irineochytrium annulatum]